MNQQTFDLLILGSSSASPTAERHPTSQILNIAERYFLIDCGEATQIQLRKYKAKLQAIDHILISHLHGDHFFGLPGLLSTMSLLGRKQKLTIYCPQDLKLIIDTINKASETVLNFEINWQFTNDDGVNLLFEDNKVEVYSFPLKHRIYCTGFLFKEKSLPRNVDKDKLKRLNISVADILKLKKGFDVVNEDGKLIKNKDATIDPPQPRSYAYCSDTIFYKKIVKIIKDVNVLYHESTFLEDKKDRAKKTFHSTAKQAAEIAKLADVKKLLLGHFSARYGNLNSFTDEAKPIFENCELALEGKIFKL
ncbi:MAG: ribonuclease Z [Bacteroidota bacterium]|nr:ribonuclease Z [Bacteroidota bacterium]